MKQSALNLIPICMRIAPNRMLNIWNFLADKTNLFEFVMF